MPEKTANPSDVLQSHAHETLTAEQIAKAVARHAREHKGDQQPKQAVQGKSKKGGK